jgi:hypothetical protein
MYVRSSYPLHSHLVEFLIPNLVEWHFHFHSKLQLKLLHARETALVLCSYASMTVNRTLKTNAPYKTKVACFVRAKPTTYALQSRYRLKLSRWLSCWQVRSSKQDQIHNSIVSTLLALMDGLDSRGQVVIIGATNRIDALDGALRRPGR